MTAITIAIGVLVSIPLKSGHIVIMAPLAVELANVSIPLKSGHIVINFMNKNSKNQKVSIPLKSGHIVIT